jgi:DNA invertase Pin-like site-specific DNA recombinase
VSLSAQRAKVEGYCALHDLELVEVIADAGASAKSLDRAGLTVALGMLEVGEVEGLVIVKLDRLSRSVGDWNYLVSKYFGETKGTQLFSVHDSIDTRSAAGRLVLNIMMTVAQWEREAIAERTRDAQAHKRSKGERIGQIPYGSKLNPDRKTLEVDLADVAAASMATDLHNHGWSYRRIAEALESQGFRTKHGRPWCHSSVAKIVSTHQLCGAPT